jgi:hypothetical protein
VALAFFLLEMMFCFPLCLPAGRQALCPLLDYFPGMSKLGKNMVMAGI